MQLQSLKRKLPMIILAASFFFYFITYIPFNHDEFFMYTVDHRRDLALIGNTYLPLRSLSYVGSFSIIMYQPLRHIWNSPYSARLMGLLALIFQAMLLQKLFNIRRDHAFLFLILFMPYAFQHMVDTGPIIYHTTAIFLILYLTKLWKNTTTKLSGWKYTLSISLILFLCIWIKLSFFFILPGILILISYALFFNPQLNPYTKKIRILQLLVMLAVMTLPTYVLLNATDITTHQHYYTILTQTQRLQPLSIAWNNHFWNLLVGYYLNPLQAAHRVFMIQALYSWQGFLYCELYISILIATLCSATKTNIIANICMPLLAFLVTIFLLITSQETWAMHHVVLSFPFLIIAIFNAMKDTPTRLLYKIIFILFCITNLTLYLNILRLSPEKHTIPVDLKLFNAVMENSQYKNICFLDWGMGSPLELYNNTKQQRIFMANYSEIQLPTNQALLNFVNKNQTICTYDKTKKILYVSEFMTSADKKQELVNCFKNTEIIAKIKKTFDQPRITISEAMHSENKTVLFLTNTATKEAELLTMMPLLEKITPSFNTGAWKMYQTTTH